MKSLEAGMTLYEYAKQVVAVESPMDPIAASYKYLEMAEYLMNNQYSMLLCRERNDYTVFNRTTTALTKEQIAQELKECVTPRGILLLADKLEDNSYEIWIRDKESQENFYYRLFGCEGFVLTI